MQSVAAAAGDGVDDAAGSAAVFRQEVGRDHLEFLDGVLRNVVGARAAGVLVVELIGGVVAIRQEGVAAGIAAEGNQPKGAVGGYARGEEHERIDAPSIDGEIENLFRGDDLRNVGFAFIDYGRLSRYFHLRGGGGNGEDRRQADSFPYRYGDVFHLVGGEAGQGDGYVVSIGGNQIRRRESAGGIGDKFAVDPLGLILHHDFRVGSRSAAGIRHHARNSAKTSRTLAKQGPGGQKQEDCEAG